MNHRTNTAELLALDAPRFRWERRQLELALPEYQVVREIGRGGMGVVFLARDVVLQRLVAIKVLRRELAASEEHRDRFLLEARLTARLDHPNIVAVHRFGSLGELSYAVMKYVDGVSLAQRIEERGPLPPEEAREALYALAVALHHAHSRGVLHRDLKAENIILERGSGRPMLTDFGVAALRGSDPQRADARRAFGTPQYMSPEQAMGELDIDERSDVYALGVLGYYMVSGRLPFDGSTFAAIAARQVAEPAQPLRRVAPHVSPRFAACVDRCLRKNRDERWRTAGELATALADRTPMPPRWLAWLTSARRDSASRPGAFRPTTRRR